MMMNRRFLTDANELCRLGVGQLTAGFSSGRFTPLEVAQATLARAEQVQERFNAFSLIDVDGALAMAKESTARWRSGTPLSSVDGVPTTIKDIVWVKDWAVRYGSRTTSTTPCSQDAPSVKRLRAAGAVLIGLTTTPEFGWKAITDSPLTGVTRNPWNPKMTPGGSSGGAVVAAATGAGVLHIGTDGGGSIRIPSSLTGVVGLKPTFGRVAAYPPSAFGTVAHIGPIGRSAEDAAAMLGVMAGRDIDDWNQGVGELPPLVLKGAFSRARGSDCGPSLRMEASILKWLPPSQRQSGCWIILAPLSSQSSCLAKIWVKRFVFIGIRQPPTVSQRCRQILRICVTPDLSQSLRPARGFWRPRWPPHSCAELPSEQPWTSFWPNSISSSRRQRQSPPSRSAPRFLATLFSIGVSMLVASPSRSISVSSQRFRRRVA